MDNAYPNRTNALHEVGLATPISPTMGELWKYQDEKWILTNKMTLMPTNRKTEMSNFVLHTHVTFVL